MRMKRCISAKNHAQYTNSTLLLLFIIGYLSYRLSYVAAGGGQARFMAGGAANAARCGTGKGFVRPIY